MTTTPISAARRTRSVGFKLKPIDQFAVRGAYSESFRAPGPAETGGSSFGFTDLRHPVAGQSEPQARDGQELSLGVVVEPVPNTSLTVDYWQVKRKDEIIQADPNAIIPAGQCQTLCDGTGGNPDLTNQRLPGIAPNTFLFYDSAGNLTVTGFFVNAAKTNTDGVDARTASPDEPRRSGQAVGAVELEPHQQARAHRRAMASRSTTPARTDRWWRARAPARRRTGRRSR